MVPGVMALSSSKEVQGVHVRRCARPGVRGRLLHSVDSCLATHLFASERLDPL